MSEHTSSLGGQMDLEIYSRNNYNLYSPEHVHDHYEMYYLMSGQVKYFVDNKIFNLQAGDIIFIQKGLIHKTTYPGHQYNERMLIVFDDEFLGQDYYEIVMDLGKQKYVRLPSKKQLEAEALLKRIAEEFGSRDSHKNLMTKNLVRELLILLHRQRQTETRKVLSDNEITMQHAAKYIADNYSDNLTLPSLAAAFAMSQSHFSKTFKALTGFGVTEYITLIRVTEAEKLLKSEHLSITEVASRCGFNDSNYFASVFKKKNGITPLKYSVINRRE